MRSGDGIRPAACNVQRQIGIHRPRSETANNIREVKIMKEGIHPSYYQAKVVCNCGNEFVTGSTKKTSMWRFAPSAIHSTPDSRRLLRLVDVLTSSIVNMA